MTEDIEIYQSVEAQRKRVVDKITMESEKLIDELLMIIYNQEIDENNRPIVDPKVKLSAIAMLLDRGIPKLAVDNTKSEVIEESRARKQIRTEIEELVKGAKKELEK